MNSFYTNKQQIISWLEKVSIENYTLIPDEQYGFVVNVNGKVILFAKNLISIPVKFNEVSGNFWCSFNNLTSLEFCPEIVGGSFDCEDNKLTSLNFCPKTVGGNFRCGHNKLTSLEFSPQKVGADFWCNNNQLTSLEFCPQEVSGFFYCDYNLELKDIQKITDFKRIYLEHEQILKHIIINKFSDQLDNDLSNDKSKRTVKIKI